MEALPDGGRDVDVAAGEQPLAGRLPSVWRDDADDRFRRLRVVAVQNRRGFAVGEEPGDGVVEGVPGEPFASSMP
jgi:hypothetical protein